MYRGTTSCEIGVNGQQTDDWMLDGQIAGKNIMHLSLTASMLAEALNNENINFCIK